MLSSKQNGRAKSKKSTFRKVSEWLHLWLGLISGIIVFVVCLTGALWVFRYEVWYFTEKYQQVEPRKQAFLPPSALMASARAYCHQMEHRGSIITGITYGKPHKAVIIAYQLSAKEFYSLYLNPYTGQVLEDRRKPTAAEQFFIFVRAGHRFFWLPKAIGSPLVGSACIIFLITLITGLIWWYPAKWTRKTCEKSFQIKWTANRKRLNIDLHNVFGFYALLFIMALTISGVVFTFEWFENGVYRTLTWKAKKDIGQPYPSSDTTLNHSMKIVAPVDLIWATLHKKYLGQFGRMAIDIPEKAKDPYQVFVNMGDGTILYNNQFHYFDQTTLKELPHTTERTRPYQQLSAGEKVFRMNFDIHTGQILGLPTKILAFFTSIIGASLPVTGFIIWYNRKWGKKKRRNS